MLKRAFNRAWFAGLSAAIVLLSSAAVLASETLDALQEAVAGENWSLAIELVDRLEEEQGSSEELVVYRARLEKLHTRAQLAGLAADLENNPREIVVTPDPQQALERELQRQAILDAREARLAAREARRELRNQERQQRAEEDYLQALELESLARTNAINARRSRTVICGGYYCGGRRFYVNGGYRYRDIRYPHGVRP